MKIRTVLLAVAATSALSTAAFAAANDRNDTNHPSSRDQMSSQCSALESQYNHLVEDGMNAPKADKAAGLHAQGVSACESNNSDIGVQKLEQAVRELGAKPAA